MANSNQNIADIHQAALKALNDNDARQAHQHCLAILKIDPTFADAWFLCAVIAAQNGQTGKAIEILQRAISFSPENSEYHTELGKQLLAANQPEGALTAALRALHLNPQDLPTLSNLGALFSHAGEHAQALKCFEKAANKLQDNAQPSRLSQEWRAQLYFNMGASLQFSGRFTESELAFEKAIELEPNLFKAHSALSTVRKQTTQDNHLDRLSSLRKLVTSPDDQLYLGHAIAKEQEDLEQYEESFASLAWGKQAIAAELNHQFDDDQKQFSHLKELFSIEHMAQRREGYGSREPIFIVGMPRTGTTLVEQILSSHSSVFAAGELQNFPLQVKRLCGSATSEFMDIATLNASVSLDNEDLGESYITSTRPRTGHTAHFIDKLPMNFMYLGLIHRALPNAKIVCLRRDPMDTCLSNYRQLFALNFKHSRYNYDLLNCGRYYIEFDRLMQHWRDTIPDAVFEVKYEELVAAPEKHTRKIVNYCGLDWEDQCLDFHNRQTSVATPSAVQVRQKIYQTSVNRWKRYGDALQPLYELLQKAGYYD